MKRRAMCTVDLKEPIFLLLVLGDVNLVRRVRYSELLKSARNFLAVGCAGRVSIKR